MHLFDGLDWGTYYFFRFQANHLPALGDLMRAGPWLGSYLALALLAALTVAITPARRRWRTALVVLAATLLGVVLVEGLKLVTDRPPPPDAQATLGSAGLSSSFPSQAVFMAAFGWAILGHALAQRTSRRWPGLGAYVGAALAIVFVCVSELWLGLHFVTDVIAGLTGGLALALSAFWAGSFGTARTDSAPFANS